jgi:hypothetical protein
VLRAGLGIRSRFFTDSEVLFALQRSWYDLRRESGIDYGSTSQSGTAALLRRLWLATRPIKPLPASAWRALTCRV